MPELPEVETVKRGLQPFMEGQQVKNIQLNRKDLRFEFPKNMAQNLSRQRIISLDRRAKFLLLHFANEMTLLCHLGMSGRFVIEPPSPFSIENDESSQKSKTIAEVAFIHNAPRHMQHDHVVFILENGTRIIYNDPRRFGYMDLFPSGNLERSKHLINLGPEPLGNNFHAPHLLRYFAKSHRSLKALLLDQKIVAGLGNIYVCEALFRAKLSPFSTGIEACSHGKKIEQLVLAIREILTIAIEAGGSSLKDHRQANGELGYFQHQFNVYDKEGCACVNTDCGGIISREMQNGRSTFYCPICQSR